MKLILGALTVLCLAEGTGALITQNRWRNNGNTVYQIEFTLPLDSTLENVWWLALDFSYPVTEITEWDNGIESTSADYKHWLLKNPRWSTTFTDQFNLKIHATVSPQRDTTIEINACLKGSDQQDIVCESTTTVSITTVSPVTTQSTVTTISTETNTYSSPRSSSQSTTSSGDSQPVVASVQCPSNQWTVNGITTFQGRIRIEVNENTGSDWTLELTFSEPVTDLMVYSHAEVRSSTDDTSFILESVSYTRDLRTSGSPYLFGFQATALSTLPSCNVAFDAANSPASGTVTASTESSLSSSSPSTTESSPSPSTTESSSPSPSSSSTTTTSTSPSPSTPKSSSSSSSTTTTTTSSSSSPPAAPYNYTEVLYKSILFYEAQRSGDLPSDNRIPWRGDSALNDRAPNGHDLTGGWYDAGDHVKFNFPMSASVTMLAWGILEFWDGYVKAGELENALDSIRWPLDYLIKCHPTPNMFYAQVGEGHTDHSIWRRAEDITSQRPVYNISEQRPGSDLAAEAAAAMAAASMVFNRYGDIAYSDTLDRHARDLYDFAYNYRGKYSDSVPEAADFYNSWSGYNDELAYGALWLYRATGERHYMQKAEEFYANQVPKLFSWDNKVAGAHFLFYSLGSSRMAQARKNLEQFLQNWFHGGSGIVRTPKGLSWGDNWGSLRYASNAAFLALVAGKEGILTQESTQFARQQIHYMLGDTGHSFVCGFGHNPPQRPHHRGSSCGNKNCNWSDYHKSEPNPNVLYGALVGGPDQKDEWQDKRHDFVANEVTTDFNAGFQSAVAGLLVL